MWVAIVERLLGGQPEAMSGRPTTDALDSHDRIVLASDSQLASALCAREVPALEEVFRRHATQVANAVRSTASGYYVDDVVQEVFLTLWRAPERFRPEKGALASFLVMLARTKTIDAVRSNQAWQRRHLRHGEQRKPDGGTEDEVIANASATELRTALRALPMTERVAIELAFFGGYSYREVATQLSEPEGTIKSRIRSGLHRLEAALHGLDAAEVE